MKTLKKLLIFCGLIICCGILQTINVKAASRVIKLQPDRLYRNYDVNARLLNLKNGKKLLYLYAESDDGDGYVCGLYQYVSGR